MGTDPESHLLTIFQVPSPETPRKTSLNSTDGVTYCVCVCLCVCVYVAETTLCGSAVNLGDVTS